MLEELRRVVERAEHRLGHPVVQQADRARIRRRSCVEEKCHAALDAAHRLEAAVARDVGGLGRPGRDGSRTRHDEEQLALRRRRGGAIVEQPLDQLARAGIERASALDEVAVFGGDRADAGVGFLKGGSELREAELR